MKVFQSRISVQYCYKWECAEEVITGACVHIYMHICHHYISGETEENKRIERRQKKRKKDFNIFIGS